MNLFVFFDGNYNWPIQSGKHFLAQTISLNHNVYCFDRPNLRNLLTLILNPFFFTEKKTEKLRVIHSFSFIPSFINILILNKLFYYLNFLIFNLVSGQQEKANPIIISFTPEIYFIKNKIKKSKIFYYVLDDYLSYPLWTGKRARNNFLFLEKRLLKSCNGVILASKTLYDKYIKMHKNAFYFPNPSEIKDFIKPLPPVKIPADIKNFKLPIVGFIGGIEIYRIDFNLIKEIARIFPHYSFVIIGPINWVNKKIRLSLPQADNIHFLGYKPRNILRRYIFFFTTTIIPYKINAYGKACYPLKIYEYLALGKPVVTSALPSIKHLTDLNLIYWSKNNLEFIRNLKRSVMENKNKNLIQARINFAKKNVWSKRINELTGFIN